MITRIMLSSKSQISRCYCARDVNVEEMKSKSWFDDIFSRPNQASVGYRTGATTGGHDNLIRAYPSTMTI